MILTYEILSYNDYNTCIIKDNDSVAVCSDLGLKGLVLLYFSLEVGGILVTLIARRLETTILSIYLDTMSGLKPGSKK